jgi:hypothetical protein
MNHAAIARIFDAGVDAHGRPHFVMEYVPGEPLHTFVARHKPSLGRSPQVSSLTIRRCRKGG